MPCVPPEWHARVAHGEPVEVHIGLDADYASEERDVTAPVFVAERRESGSRDVWLVLLRAVARRLRIPRRKFRRSRIRRYLRIR